MIETELLTNVAEATDPSKKEEAAVREVLAVEIQKNLGNMGAGAIAIPGLLKMRSGFLQYSASP